MPLPNTWIRRKRSQQSGGLPDVFTYDDLPQPFRVQTINILVASLGGFREMPPWETFTEPPPSNKCWRKLEKILAHEFGLFRLGNDNNSTKNFVDFFMDETDIDRLLVCIELALRAVDNIARNWSPYDQRKSGVEQEADSAITELNERLIEAGIGYQWLSGEIIQVDNLITHQHMVKPALQLLSSPLFTGANQEYLEAHEHFREGRYRDANTSANKAFESAMKTICDKRGWSYTAGAQAATLVQLLFSNGLIPTYLQAQFNSLKSLLESGAPTVRNKAGAHGQGGTPVQTPAYLANYTLNLVAANIVLLVAADSALP